MFENDCQLTMLIHYIAKLSLSTAFLFAAHDRMAKCSDRIPAKESLKR